MYRYQHTVDGDGCFDPETVIILSAAYDEARRSLQNSRIYFTSSRKAEASRERLAQRIIENAKGGERDPCRLRDNALLDLTRSSGSQFVARPLPPPNRLPRLLHRRRTVIEATADTDQASVTTGSGLT
jgi:hypothetical protein